MFESACARIFNKYGMMSEHQKGIVNCLWSLVSGLIFDYYDYFYNDYLCMI